MAEEHTTLLRVLMVEDCEEDSILVARELRQGFDRVEHRRVESEDEMRRALEEERWQLVIVDYTLPRFDVFAAIRIAHELDEQLPVIAVSGRVGEDAAVDTLKSGACDFVAKDNLLRLVPAVRRELRDAEIRRERKRVQEAFDLEAAVSADLARVSRQLIESLNHSVLLDRLCTVTAEVFECHRAAIILPHPDGGGFQMVAECTSNGDARPSSHSVKLPRSDLAAVLERLADSDVAEASDFAHGEAPSLGGSEAAPKRAFYVALRLRDALIGILAATDPRPPDGDTTRQRRVASEISKIASMALANARLFEELERANRLKSEFVATVSHELRTPLNVILGYIDLLLSGEFGELSEEQDETLGRVNGTAVQLHHLVEEVLQVGRLESGEWPVHLARCDPNAVLEELCDEMREATKKRSVDVEWRRCGDVSPLITDKSKLKVVLRNLIQNAIKFTQQGRVEIGVRDCGDWIDFEVRDTGMGIAPEVLPVIFEAFRQGDASPTRLHGGIGLGLYTVDRLLGLMGGSVDVESEVSTGSTFRVHLPKDGLPKQETNAVLGKNGASPRAEPRHLEGAAS